MSETEAGIRHIPIAVIRVGERLRNPSEDDVAKLAESMKEIGLRTAIHVRPLGQIEIAVDATPKQGEVQEQQFMLIAGATRLAAAKKLGWAVIDAVVFKSDDPLIAEMWQIDENLKRKELTAEEMHIHLVRRKEIWERKGGASRATPGGMQKIGFAADTAAKVGKSKSQINRGLASPKGKMGATGQKQNDRKAASGPAKDKRTGSAPDPAAHLEPNAVASDQLVETMSKPSFTVDEEVKMLIETYGKASEEARAQFLIWLNETHRPADTEGADHQKRLAEIEAEMASLGPYREMLPEQKKRATVLQQEKDRLRFPQGAAPAPKPTPQASDEPRTVL